MSHLEENTSLDFGNPLDSLLSPGIFQDQYPGQSDASFLLQSPCGPYGSNTFMSPSPVNRSNNFMSPASVSRSFDSISDDHSERHSRGKDSMAPEFPQVIMRLQYGSNSTHSNVSSVASPNRQQPEDQSQTNRFDIQDTAKVAVNTTHKQLRIQPQQTNDSALSSSDSFIRQRTPPHEKARRLFSLFNDLETNPITGIGDIRKKHETLARYEAPSVVAQWNDRHMSTMLPSSKPDHASDYSGPSPLSGSRRRKRSATDTLSLDPPGPKKFKYTMLSTPSENNPVLGNSYAWSSVHHAQCKCISHPGFTEVIN